MFSRDAPTVTPGAFCFGYLVPLVRGKSKSLPVMAKTNAQVKRLLPQRPLSSFHQLGDFCY